MWDAAVAYWRTLPSDPGVTYDREIEIDCSTLAPQLTWGTSPPQVLAVDGRVPAPTDIADPGTRKLHERALEYMQLTPGTSADPNFAATWLNQSCDQAKRRSLTAARRTEQADQQPCSTVRYMASTPGAAS